MGALLKLFNPPPEPPDGSEGLVVQPKAEHVVVVPGPPAVLPPLLLPPLPPWSPPLPPLPPWSPNPPPAPGPDPAPSGGGQHCDGSSGHGLAQLCGRAAGVSVPLVTFIPHGLLTPPSQQAPGRLPGALT